MAFVFSSSVFAVSSAILTALSLVDSRNSFSFGPSRVPTCSATCRTPCSTSCAISSGIPTPVCSAEAHPRQVAVQHLRVLHHRIRVLLHALHMRCKGLGVHLEHRPAATTAAARRGRHPQRR